MALVDPPSYFFGSLGVRSRCHSRSDAVNRFVGFIILWIIQLATLFFYFGAEGTGLILLGSACASHPFRSFLNFVFPECKWLPVTVIRYWAAYMVPFQAVFHVDRAVNPQPGQFRLAVVPVPFPAEFGPNGYAQGAALRHNPCGNCVYWEGSLIAVIWESLKLHLDHIPNRIQSRRYWRAVSEAF